MSTSEVEVIVSDIAVPDMQKFVQEGDSKEVGELQNALEVSSEVGVSLACSLEKLTNLETLFSHILTEENDIRAIGVENDTISNELAEKAFTIDLLFAILSFELKELNSLLGDAHTRIVDALHKISSCEQPTVFFTELASKLHDSEDLIKQSQERILEIKIQIAKLQMTSFSFKQNEWRQDLVMGVKEPIQTVGQKHVLRMLEKSLAKEVEYEKRFKEFKQNEEDLKLKVRLVEQVATYMEEAAEVALGRFFEADHRAEVLMGTSKEMVGKLNTIQLTVTALKNREDELQGKLNNCINQLHAKEASIQKLNSSITLLMTDNAQVTSLREKTTSLEQKLIESDSRLKEVSSSNETSREQIKEMEVEIESLKEVIHDAESRALSSEEKVIHLTESHSELVEEFDFVRGSNDSNAKKVSLLEKQLREMDVQLKHTRASSDAGQEQQQMLYSAIWDMETLIDELKQKVSHGESKVESVEEQRDVLSEKNLELNKELDFLKARIEFMDMALEHANLEKKSNAKDISLKTSLIMDTVMQLAMERESIKKQLVSLTKENILLKRETKKFQKHASPAQQDNLRRDDNGLSSFGLGSTDVEPAKVLVINATEITSEILQVEKLPEDFPLDKNESTNSSSIIYNTDLDQKLEAESLKKTDKSWKLSKLTPILVLLLSVLAAYLLHQKSPFFKPVES